MIKSKGVTIVYKDVPVGAKEHFEATANNKEAFVDMSQFSENNLNITNTANAIDGYGIALDGSIPLAFPNDPYSEDIGYWSASRTGENGRFARAIMFTLTSDQTYTTQGLTFVFDELMNVFCTNMRVMWYRGDELLSDMEYQPNSAVYSLENKVEECDTIKVYFRALNMPFERLKIKSIEYGYDHYFYGDELKSASVSQDIDLLSASLKVNNTDFDLASKSDKEFTFQQKQTVKTYFNGNLKSTTFVKSARRTGRKKWSISTEDYIGTMASITFRGGIYDGVNAVDLIKDIFSVAKIPYQIVDDLTSETITGYLPYTNCRNALMQVLFAAGAVADTSNSDKVRIFKLKDEMSQKIPLNRIKLGQNLKETPLVTEVALTAHTYSKGTERKVLYEASKSGAGESILVKFNEPMHSLNIVDGSIVEQGANYAVINATETAILTGAVYLHSQSITRRINPEFIQTNIENVKRIETATLINAENVDKIADLCYNVFARNIMADMAIVEGKTVTEEWVQTDEGYTLIETVEHDKAVNVGDLIAFDTPYEQDVQARVVSQKYRLFGNIVVKNVTAMLI